MAYRLLADIVTVLHLAFVAFVLLGGFLVLRWRGSIWIHGPAVLWGAVVEWAGWVCPLTPLENWLRLNGHVRGYAGGFVEHYLVPVLYPKDGRPVQRQLERSFEHVLPRRTGDQLDALRRGPAQGDD